MALKKVALKVSGAHSVPTGSAPVRSERNLFSARTATRPAPSMSVTAEADVPTQEIRPIRSMPTGAPHLVMSWKKKY